MIPIRVVITDNSSNKKKNEHGALHLYKIRNEQADIFCFVTCIAKVNLCQGDKVKTTKCLGPLSHESSSQRRSNLQGH